MILNQLFESQTLTEEFGSRYAEKLAQRLYDEHPDLDTAADEDAVLDHAFELAQQELGQRRAHHLFAYDQDFAGDLLAAYSVLSQGQGVAEGQLDELNPDTLKSYLKKSKGHAQKYDELGNKADQKGDEKTANKMWNKGDNRYHGAALAKDKLAGVAEGVNVKQIKKDIDSGMSLDAVIGKHANRRLTNTDEIRRVIQQHAWEKRKNKSKEQGVSEARYFKTSYGWAGGQNPKTGKKYKHPEQIKADREAKKKAKEKQKNKQQDVAEGRVEESAMGNIKRIYMDLIYDLPMGTPESEFLLHWQRIIKNKLGQDVDSKTLAKLSQEYKDKSRRMSKRKEAWHYDKEMRESGVSEGAGEVIPKGRYNDWDYYAYDPKTMELKMSWSDKDRSAPFKEKDALAKGWEFKKGSHFNYGQEKLKLAAKQQPVKEALPAHIKKSDLPPAMRSRMTMKDVEAERPQGAYRYRVGEKEFLDLAAARQFAAGTGQQVQPIREDQKKNSSPRIEKILKQLRVRYPQAQDDLEALIYDMRAGQRQDRTDINRLDAENDAEEAEIADIEQMIKTIRSRRAELAEKKKMSAKDDPCWSGYHMVGTKKKGGRTVPNCVPGEKGSANEAAETSYAVAVQRSGPNEMPV